VERLPRRLEAAVGAEAEARLDLPAGQQQHQRAALVGDDQRAAALQRAEVLEEGVGTEGAGVADEALPHGAPPRAATIRRSSSRSDSWVSRRSASSTGWNSAAAIPLSLTTGVWSEQRMTNHVTSRGTPRGFT